MIIGDLFYVIYFGKPHVLFAVSKKTTSENLKHKLDDYQGLT